MWGKILKHVFSLGVTYFIARRAKLKPRDVVDDILIDLYQKGIANPLDIIGMVENAIIEKGIKGRAKAAALSYAKREIRRDFGAMNGTH